MISDSLKRYYAHRPAMLRYSRAWERAHRAARTAYKAAWRKSHPPTPEQRERQRASVRRWYRRNRKAVLKKAAASRANHP